MYVDDWRAAAQWQFQLPQESREMIVNYVMETLKRHLDFSGEEEVQELKKIAVRFEEKNYTSATSQSDYLRKVSLKMLTMETESQNPMPLQDPAFRSMQSQTQNPVQQLPIPMVLNQSQAPQQTSSQNIQNIIASTGVPNSAGLASAPAPVGGTPNVTSNAGVTANTFSNHQRPIQGRQQQFVSQDSQHQSRVAGQQQMQQSMGNMMPNQQTTSQNIQNNIASTGVPNSAGLASAPAPVGVPPNVTSNAGVTANTFSNHQRPIQGRQQQFVSQDSQQQSRVAGQQQMQQNMGNMMPNQAQPPQSQPMQQLPQYSPQYLSDQLLQQHLILQQSMVADHYLMLQNMADMMLNQMQRSQTQPMQQQSMTQIQSQPGPMQPQWGLQQQVNNALPGYVQQGIQTFGSMPLMHPRQCSQQQQPQMSQMNSQMQPMNVPGSVMNNSANFHRMQGRKQQQRQQTRLQPNQLPPSQPAGMQSWPGLQNQQPSLQRSFQSMHL